jgi:hypothetical protein
MAGGGVLGKRIAGKGIQGPWLSIGESYRPRPLKCIAAKSVVARRAHHSLARNSLAPSSRAWPVLTGENGPVQRARGQGRCAHSDRSRAHPRGGRRRPRPRGRRRRCAPRLLRRLGQPRADEGGSWVQGGSWGQTWRVQFVAFWLDFELSRMPISVPSRLGPNAPGLPGRIVTLVATPAAFGCVQGWLSEEREPHTGQAGGIQGT